MKTVFVVLFEDYEYLHIAATREIAEGLKAEQLKNYPKLKVTIYEEKLHE